MGRLAALTLVSLAAVTAAAPLAEAQVRRQRGEVIVLTVRPRSYLDAGRVVPVGSLNRYASGQIVSYISSPPYLQMKDRFGEGTLPDPIGGPFVGARNPFGPIDYPAPASLR